MGGAIVVTSLCWPPQELFGDGAINKQLVCTEEPRRLPRRRCQRVSSIFLGFILSVTRRGVPRFIPVSMSQVSH